jgi:hypothetical protein
MNSTDESSDTQISDVPLSLMIIQVKERILAEDLKGKYPEGVLHVLQAMVRFDGLENVQLFILLNCLRGLLVDMLEQPIIL